MTASEDFTGLTSGFRRELLAHCYRMLGSAEEAEDHDGTYGAHAVMVLTVTPGGIARLVNFLDPGLFAAFGLPDRHGAAPAGPAAGRGLAVTRWSP